MSTLILSDEEKEMKIMEAPDKVLADCVRKAYSAMHTVCEKGNKPILFTAAQHMCVFEAMEVNAGKTTYNIEGLTFRDQPLGDWQVTIERID